MPVAVNVLNELPKSRVKLAWCYQSKWLSTGWLHELMNVVNINPKAVPTPVAGDLIKAFYYINLNRYELIAPNVYLDWQFNEMDLFGLRPSGFVDEIEIKLTRSDFLADFKKTVKVRDTKPIAPHMPNYFPWTRKLKHEALKEGIAHCNYFSFFMPVELADKCEIPEHAGLYTYSPDMWGGRVREAKKAPRLHSRKLDDQFKYKIAKKMAWRYWDTLIKA